MRETLHTMSAAASASADWGRGASGRRREPYVLVHDAWHGGWCWGKVAERLQAAGHSVFTPTLTGLGDRTHLIAPNVGLQTFVEDVVSTIDMEDLSDLVLVGHSFGDAVIGGVTDARPDRIGRLVFPDSFVLQSGQSPFSQLPPGDGGSAQELGDQDLAFTARPSSCRRRRSVFGVTDPEGHGLGRETPQAPSDQNL